MTELENTVRNELQHAQAVAEAGRIPDFNDSWAVAEARVAERGRRHRVVGVAAAAAVVAIAYGLLPSPEMEWRYINRDELVSTTSWVAPSDVLMPKHQVDLYGEIPVLIESTKTEGGALL